MAEKELEEGKSKKVTRKTETKLGYKLDEVASALQKEIRRGDEEAAVYWALLLQSAAPQYAWKRTLVAAAEDIGIAAPETVAQVSALAQAWKISKEHAWYVSPHHLTMAVVLLCRAPKSTEVEDLLSYTDELIRRGIKRDMPDYAVDGHTQAGRAKGVENDAWYDNRHFMFGIPVNRYTKKLADLVPSWFSDKLKAMLKSKEDSDVQSKDS